MIDEPTSLADQLEYIFSQKPTRPYTLQEEGLLDTSIDWVREFKGKVERFMSHCRDVNIPVTEENAGMLLFDHLVCNTVPRPWNVELVDTLFHRLKKDIKARQITTFCLGLSV